jgi:hypothetical protein
MKIVRLNRSYAATGLQAIVALLLLTLLSFGVLPAFGSSAVTNPDSQPDRRADLMIQSAELVDSTAGTLKVVVRNKGISQAGVSTLRLIVWEIGKFEKKAAKQVFVEVPAIPGGKIKVVNVTAGVPIISTKYSLYADISNQVSESDENNNRWEGEAGKS